MATLTEKKKAEFLPMKKSFRKDESAKGLAKKKAQILIAK